MSRVITGVFIIEREAGESERCEEGSRGHGDVRTRAKERRWPPESREGKGTNAPGKPAEGTRPEDTLALTP